MGEAGQRVDEKGGGMKMTDRQREMARDFSSVIFCPGSYNKSFCQSMMTLANNDDAELTEKQAALLEVQYHRYRRQIKNHERHCSICDKRLRKAAG